MISPIFHTEEFVAKTLAGLEEVLAEELTQLGATNIIKRNRAVTFSGDKQLLYTANLCLRTALSILKPIHSFTAKDENELYDMVQKVDWRNYLTTEDTFAISSAVFSPTFKHSHYISLKCKDAIVDQLRSRTGKRPSIDIHNPTLKLNLHIYNHQCTLSMDTSGTPLFQRGYRKLPSSAPLNEVLAAGMIILTEWDKTSSFVDPMCGSGTLPIEAAMYALNIPPGINRASFGFMNWKDYDSNLWNKIREDALSKIQGSSCSVYGYDLAKQSIQNAMSNARPLPISSNIRFGVKRLENVFPKKEEGLVIMNPPYGLRMTEDNIFAFYKSIGDSLKKNFTGFDAWVISSNMEALKHVGLKASKKIRLFNGPLECSFRKYTLY